MARPDDNDVIDVDLVYLRVKAQAFGHLRITRIAKRRLVAADDNRDVGYAKSKILKQLFDRGIRFQIEVSKGLVVACQKFLEAKCVARKPRADQNKASKMTRDYTFAGDCQMPAKESRQVQSLSQQSGAKSLDGLQEVRRR